MIEEKVFNIISEQFDVDKSKLSLETNLVEDLHADSLDLVELIMAFEDEFGLTMDDDSLEQIETIGDAVDAIANAQ